MYNNMSPKIETAPKNSNPWNGKVHVEIILATIFVSNKYSRIVSFVFVVFPAVGDLDLSYVYFKSLPHSRSIYSVLVSFK